MNSYKTLNNIVGWLVFAISATVFFFSAERTGSLWDCGEFVAGCYKLQVVHPPGAPLFLMIGKIAISIGQMFSSDPSVVAFSVNLLSGICTALAATFVCWSTVILGKLALVGRSEEPTQGQFIALAGAGLVAGLTTAFADSIWFSAVEGEVYAMSLFFTALTMWAMIKWYNLPDVPDSDRWMLLAVYAAGLSVGVHLLSLLTFPALALFYYFKKTETPNFKGILLAGVIGVVSIAAIQTLVITGIPALWGALEIFCVNTLGLPFIFPSLILTVGILVAMVYLILNLAKKGQASTFYNGILGFIIWLIAFLGSDDIGFFKFIVLTALAVGLTYAIIQMAKKGQNTTVQNIGLGLAFSIIGFSTVGMVLLRANANPPINMNNPSDPIKVIPYLNREQYGERPLLYGPQFNADMSKAETVMKDRYGRVGDKYEVVDRKITNEFPSDQKVFFPRMGHYESDREDYYKLWMDLGPNEKVPSDRPTTFDNFSFFLRYQVGWMYNRYLMWNFVGRQNAEQGFTPIDKSKGNWASGIPAVDNARLFSYEQAPEWIKNDPAYNKYYFLPLIFGILGLVWHYSRRRFDALGLAALFVIMGLGIIVYTNEPPNEPRERDYVIVGSVMTFAIWIGMGVLWVYEQLSKFKVPQVGAAALASLLVCSAPFLMGTQNFDDHSRAKHTGARDYAINFLESCEKNAIIFTYGDNDTYPLWYAQEVEGIRTDVRVVNLSLIAVDWYIDNLRRKINQSDAIKMSLPADSYRGYKRNQIPVDGKGPLMSIYDVMTFIGKNNPVPVGNGMTLESYAPTRNIYIPIDKEKAIKNGIVAPTDAIVDSMTFSLSGNYLIKDDIAVLDIIAQNIHERPIYFAVTCRPEKMQGLNDYTQLEGLAVRLLPVKGGFEPRSGMLGAAVVKSDKILDLMKNKFKWGNFDKEKTFINRSYNPSVQTTQFVVLRAAETFLRNRENAKAIEILEKNFQAFPNMNFPYNSFTLNFIQMYIAAGGKEPVKKHIDILADNMVANLKFYASLSPDVLNSTFASDRSGDVQTVNQLLALVQSTGDTAYLNALLQRFTPYGIKAPQPLPQMSQGLDGQ